MVLGDHAVLAHVHLVHETKEVRYTTLLAPTQTHLHTNLSLKVDSLYSIRILRSAHGTNGYMEGGGMSRDCPLDAEDAAWERLQLPLMSGKEGKMPLPPAEPARTGLSEQQVATQQVKTKSRRSYMYVVAAVPLLLALLAYRLPVIIDEYEAYFGYGEAPMYELPPGVMDAFRTYDQDGDGFIDPYEFVPLGMRVREQVRKLLLNTSDGGKG